MASPGDHAARVRALFDALAELDDDRARQAGLAAADETPAVRAEVEALLAADRAAEGATALSPEWVSRLGGELTSRVGDRVGDYRLVELIGAGGMGDVYRAERADGGFEQQVAIKLVRGDLGWSSLAAGFVEERQVLARLQHPHIAALYGGGVTDGGHPYLVMELIDGAPIDRHCAERGLSVAARLGLLEQVCDAVAHAHGELIVHRDLKPDNVLVTGDGRVKLLDFGIAAALGADASGRAGRAMTPGYVAPEIAVGAPGATAADIYSLGVMLHELVTGRRPAAAADVDRGLPTDLAAICARALASEPGHRYATVAALADDLRAVRQHRPVAARDGGWIYRAGRLIRRHRVASLTLVAAVLAVVTVVAVSTARLADQRDRAQSESRRARATAAVLTSIFTAADPAERAGEPLEVRELLARGRRRVDAELADDPAERARLYGVLAAIHVALGHAAEAEALYRDAAALHAELGQRAAHSEALVGVSGALRERSQLDDAEATLREAYALSQATGGGSTVDTATIVRELAAVHYDQGRYQDALTLARVALVSQRAVDAGAAEQLASLHIIGDAQMELADDAAAEGTFRAALALALGERGELDPATANLHIALGAALRHQQRFDEAEGHYRQAVATQRRLYEGDHPDLAHGLNHLARLLHQAGRPAEAEPIYRDALAMRRRLYGSRHAAVAASLGGLAQAVADLGRADEAVALTREARELLTTLHGPAHPYVVGITMTLARLLLARGDAVEAAELAGAAVARVDESYGRDHPRAAEAHAWHGRALCAAGRVADGLAALTRADADRAHLPLDGPGRAAIRVALRTCRGDGDPVDGAPP